MCFYYIFSISYNKNFLDKMLAFDLEILNSNYENIANHMRLEYIILITCLSVLMVT